MPIDLDRVLVTPTDAQRDLYEMLCAYAAERIAPGAMQRDREHRFPADILGELAEMGMMAAKVPECDGGGGFDNLAYLLAMEALTEGDASVSVVVAASNLVSKLLADHASEDQKSRWLAPLCDGRFGPVSFCLSEPQAGSDAAALATTARRVDGGWRLTGSKMWITSGAYAGMYLVFARTGQGRQDIGAFLVPRGAEGLEIGKEERKMGQRSSGTVALHLDDLFVPDEDVLGEPTRGYALALEALGAGRVGISGLCLGLGEAALAEALAYTVERRAFGKRIADFQNSRFALADCRIDLDAAWTLAVRAARLLDAGHTAGPESSMAKVFASEAADRVIDRCVQLHGGYGYSEEYTVERLYRDIRVTRIYEGSSEIQRLVIARSLVG
ncbi:MAG: acyl-CoA dehydrogenase [Deltaproteobacteria bacterium]|nr:MAG: acyl-CoA dehydrogenase [Deltaproteobacteria bacterium]